MKERIGNKKSRTDNNLEVSSNENSSDDELENDSESEEEILETDGLVNVWLIDVLNLKQYITKVAVCRGRGKNLTFREKKSSRVGLKTKFVFECMNTLCPQNKNNDGFFTSNEDINKKSCLAFRAIGKGRTALEKVSSIIGLNSPINKNSYANMTKLIEEKAFDLRCESMKTAAENAKKSSVHFNGDMNEIIDIPTSFDGSWKSKGWSSLKGIATAIADETGQIIDVAYKNNSCHQCNQMDEKKQNGVVTEIEYMDWFLEHENSCFHNHDGSSQVYFLYL